MKLGISAVTGRFIPLLGAILTLTISSPMLATEVHTWTDEDGVVHFSDVKPASTKSQAIEMKDNSSQAADSLASPVTPAPVAEEDGVQTLTAAQQRRQDMEEAREAQREEQAEIEKMCARHAQRLEQMEPARRVYYQDENGQEVRMDDVQRVALIEESRNYLAENCN